MENQILIGILKSQLRIDAEWLNRIESLTAQIKELEAVPDTKPVYEVKELSKDKPKELSRYVRFNCNYYVSKIETGQILNTAPLNLKDAELLCKLANNQKP